MLNDGVGLRAQARAHEEFLDVAQAAEFPVQVVLAGAVAVEPPGDHHLARPDSQIQPVLALLAAPGSFLGVAGFGRLGIVFRRGGFRRGLALRFGRRGLGLGVEGLRVDQGEGDFGQVGRGAAGGAVEDAVGHAAAAQGLGALLAQHPENGVGDVRLAAAVRPHHGGDAGAVEEDAGAVGERLEAEHLDLAQAEHARLLQRSWSRTKRASLKNVRRVRHWLSCKPEALRVAEGKASTGKEPL